MKRILLISLVSGLVFVRPMLLLITFAEDFLAGDDALQKFLIATVIMFFIVVGAVLITLSVSRRCSNCGRVDLRPCGNVKTVSKTTLFGNSSERKIADVWAV